MEAPVQLNNFSIHLRSMLQKTTISFLIGHNETLCFLFYYIDTSVLMEITPLAKIHTKAQPELEWRIFQNFTSEDIDDFTDIKLHLNLISIALKFVDWCMIETSSALHRTSSIIFGSFRNMFGNVCVTFRQIFEVLRKSWKSARADPGF